MRGGIGYPDEGDGGRAGAFEADGVWGCEVAEMKEGGCLSVLARSVRGREAGEFRGVWGILGGC